MSGKDSQNVSSRIEIVTRRGVLLGGLGLALTACTSTPTTTSKTTTTTRSTYHERPDTPWPGQVHAPSHIPKETTIRRVPSSTPVPQQTRRVVVRQPEPKPVTPVTPTAVISRAHWTNTGAVTSHINAMRGINRITVHHEGWVPVHFSDQSTTAARLKKIQRVHIEDRGWADIGYHYIIDRAGRVWEGRDIRYQGAHVRNNNPHNIGIMVLGNFDKQQPSAAQVNALVATLRNMVKTYRIPVRNVKTHQELNPTACPGKSLQARMNAIRSGSTLA